MFFNNEYVKFNWFWSELLIIAIIAACLSAFSFDNKCELQNL